LGSDLIIMSQMLHSAVNSVTSWMTTECHEEEQGEYKFYCDSSKLIAMILEKAKERDKCVEEKVADLESPCHKKCPSPALFKTSKILPQSPRRDSNLLTEKLLSPKADDCPVGIRVGDGMITLELMTESHKEGYDLLLLKVDDASSETLRKLSSIPEYASTILAICFDCSPEDQKKLDNAVHGPSFSWKLSSCCSVNEEDEDSHLPDKDFDAFLAIARATIVLHVIQVAGF